MGGWGLSAVVVAAVADDDGKPGWVQILARTYGHSWHYAGSDLIIAVIVRCYYLDCDY